MDGKAAEKRIAELERRVGELAAGMAKLGLQDLILSARLDGMGQSTSELPTIHRLLEELLEKMNEVPKKQ